MLTLATLRLPMAFTGVFLLVDVALLLLFLGFNAIPTSTGLLRRPDGSILVFAAIGVYLYADVRFAGYRRRRVPPGRAAPAACAKPQGSASRPLQQGNLHAGGAQGGDRRRQWFRVDACGQAEQHPGAQACSRGVGRGRADAVVGGDARHVYLVHVVRS